MAQATGKRETAALETLVDLFHVLNEHEIRYCHWKSNLRLEKGLAGQTDLDILVDVVHADEVKRLLTRHSVKLVVAPPGKRYPGLENYLGFDPQSGRLFHLHVHYQLALGQQFVKNYRLPLESQFLDSAQIRMGVKVPAPELEIIVLSLRALLKYRDRDAVKDLLSIRSPGIPAHILDEVHWLLGQTSIQRIGEQLAMISEAVPPDPILEFLSTVVVTPRDGRALYRLRGRVRRALQVYQRDDGLRASLRYLRELWRRRSLLRFHPENKMTLPRKGITLALIGADGSGKTTLSKELATWLAWKADIHLYYLGSKQPSARSRWLYILFRIARRSHHTLSRLAGEKGLLSRSLEAVRQVLLYSHYLSVGLDRFRRYRLGKKKEQCGSLVIFDRFPLESPLDGPRIRLAAQGHNGAMAGRLSRMERDLYRRFQSPSLLVILHVRPEVSIRRKPDHDWQAIDAKNSALQLLKDTLEKGPGKPDWVWLDANAPLEDVSEELRRAVWAAI